MKNRALLMRLRNLIKLFMPPIFIRIANRLHNTAFFNCRGITGEYRNWEEAVASSTGYGSRIILEKTREALLKVKYGEAVYERDSVLFNEIEYSWPLLAGLMWAAAKSGGKINVLDFGGSLGSTYYQNRRFLHDFHDVGWNIVEQSPVVEEGRKMFENGELRFYDDIQACLKEQTPEIVILSGVLQYLQEPYVLLEKILRPPFKYVLIDRTSFWNGKKDLLKIQKVPSHIFEARYPIWVFSLEGFRKLLAPHETKCEFSGFEKGYNGCCFKGFIIGIKDASGTV